MERQLHKQKLIKRFCNTAKQKKLFCDKQMTNNQDNNSYSEPTDEKIIPIIEETAVLKKEIVESGKVLISKRISEHEKVIDEPLLKERVSVERISVNRFIETAPEIRYDGDTMIIPVVEEQLILQKRLCLVEELHVKKQMIETHKPQTVVLRKENIDVKRSAATEDFDEKR